MTTKTVEQEVVEEFSDVFRRHSAQEPETLARLAREAFCHVINPRPTRRDKLALAVSRGLEARLQLMEAEGGSLASDEVARRLGISKTAVLKRLDRGRLLAWREERLNAARFPAWQFDERGGVLDGMPDTLERLSANERLDVWAKILFFLQGRSLLDDKRPLDLLRKGETAPVLLAADAYAE